MMYDVFLITLLTTVTVTTFCSFVLCIKTSIYIESLSLLLYSKLLLKIKSEFRLTPYAEIQIKQISIRLFELGLDEAIDLID